MKDCPGFIFKVHDWTKWAEYSKGFITNTHVESKLEITEGQFINQKRECIQCGLVQLRQECLG